MAIGQLLWSLWSRDPQVHVAAARQSLAENHPILAKWHWDAAVDKQPGSAASVARECAGLEAPRLAKRYYKRAVATAAPADQPPLLWQLGQQYMHLARESPRRARTHVARGMDSYLRAETLDPAAYGPHASRLRGLLDGLSQTMFGISWADAQATGLASLTVVEPPPVEVLREIVVELAACQHILPFADELRTMGSVLLLPEMDQAQDLITTYLLPVLCEALHTPRVPRDLDLENAALGVATALATRAWAAEPVHRLLSEYCQKGRVTRETLPALLRACNALGDDPARVSALSRELVQMLQANRANGVAGALIEVMGHGQLPAAPDAPQPVRGPDPICALSPDTPWASTPLAPAISADNVLNLGKVNAAAWAACPQDLRERLKQQLSAQQVQVLSALEGGATT